MAKRDDNLPAHPAGDGPEGPGGEILLYQTADGQCRLYRDKHGQYASYLVEDPLMVFVGGSVTGQRQSQHDTDVVTALRFFADFIAEDEQGVRRLDLLLRQKDDLKDEQRRVRMRSHTSQSFSGCLLSSC